MFIRLRFNSIQNFALFIKDNFKSETKHWRLSGSATFLIHVAEKHRNRGAYFRITVNTALKHHTIRTVCEEKASKLILIIVHRDATQSSRFIILRVHCTCFGCQPHPSSGVHKTVTTASGTGHIFCTATSLQRDQVLNLRNIASLVMINYKIHVSGHLYQIHNNTR